MVAHAVVSKIDEDTVRHITLNLFSSFNENKCNDKQIKLISHDHLITEIIIMLYFVEMLPLIYLLCISPLTTAVSNKVTVPMHTYIILTFKIL